MVSFQKIRSLVFISLYPKIKAMKKIKMISIALVTLLTIGISNSSFANPKANDPVELRYVGSVSNRPVILMKFIHSDSGVYFVNIKSMDYHLLYSEIVDGSDLSKIYSLLPKDDLDIPQNAFRVEVTSAKTNNTSVYIVNAD